MSFYERTEMLIGKDGCNRLARCRVAVFGIGGVGSYVCEALARAGVGKLDLIDGDCVDDSNINRQLIALSSTVGRPKAEVARERVLDINPVAGVEAYNLFFDASTAADFDFSEYDYVVDAIDCVTSKLLIAEMAKKSGTPLISCMGTGNKLDASAFRITDITQTSVCPLARVIRRELKARGIEHLKVLYSAEPPLKNDDSPHTPASISFVPAVAGLLIAGDVIKDLIKH